MDSINVYLPDVIGKGYATFWHSKKRYVVCKGSRGSKKSKTTALWHIFHMMKYPLANTLVIRKVDRTLRNSCFADLIWATQRLHVEALWKPTVNPLELTYIPTGQKIIFRGLDDPLKLTSIAVSTGFITFAWIEEAYEIGREADFDMIDESIRGALPDGYFKRITITLNPWNERHWIKKRFFDNPTESTLAMTTTYMCNEWLDKADMKLFEEMRVRNPRRYQVAGLGNWGVVDGLVYDNWHEKAFTLNEVRKFTTVAGVDFGYTNDPTAFFIGFLDKEGKRLYVWDEIYKKGMSNRRIYEEIVDAGYGKERIIADSAEPKSIDELKGYGLRIYPAKKGRDSVLNGIQWIQDLEILVHPRCVDFLTEIGSYTWLEDRFGKKLNEPSGDMNHLMDAMRYALEGYIKRKEWLI